MKVLLFSCNTGEGHNATARAIMEVLQAQDVQCDLRDSLVYLSPSISKFICSWHNRIYRHAPKLFDMGYRAMEHTADPDETNLVYEMLKLASGKVWRMLCEGEYDAVVCTHTFSGMVMTEVRKAWKCEVPCFFVSTDYTCHPTLEQCDFDGYFIPDGALSPEYLRAGISSVRLMPTGIPVRQGFYQKLPRQKAREQLKLPQDALIVLLMCGSMGCGPMRKIALKLMEGLPENSLVITVCGNNEKLYDTMSEIDDPRLKILGFTREIDTYMDAVDIVVTKPGGLSSTEAANKHLPMVLLNTIGGCESRNFDFFLRRGYAVGSREAAKVIALTVDLAENPAKRAEITKTLEESFTTNSPKTIARYIIEAAGVYRQRRGSIKLEENGYPLKEKGGYSMENKTKRTILNLAHSFAGEAQARTRYTTYAQVARSEGYEWIARVFEETADNEAVHAEEFLEQMQKLDGCAANIELEAGYPFQLGTTAENLQYSATAELEEHDTVYRNFAEIARREGCDDAARLWLQIARIEGVHHNAFKALHEQLVSGALTEKENPITWRCLNCGYTYEGVRACDPCPVCNKPAGWQEGELNKKQLLPKK